MPPLDHLPQNLLGLFIFVVVAMIGLLSYSIRLMGQQSLRNSQALDALGNTLSAISASMATLTTALTNHISDDVRTFRTVEESLRHIAAQMVKANTVLDLILRKIDK